MNKKGSKGIVESEPCSVDRQLDDAGQERLTNRVVLLDALRRQQMLAFKQPTAP